MVKQINCKRTVDNNEIIINIKNMFTKAERKLLKELLNKTCSLQALDYNYEQNDNKEFKEEHGISIKRAEKLFDSFINKL